MGVLPGALANAQVRQEDGSLPTSRLGLLSLSFANNGQHVSATVGQRIEITLWAIGGSYYREPQISSPAVRFEDTAMGPPNPGGPITILIFDAVAEGEADIKVPFVEPPGYPPGDKSEDRSFAVAIRVGPAPDNFRRRGVSLSLDQENSEPWNNAWMSLDYVNGPGIPPKSAIRVLSQTFVPRLPWLTAVEVELAAAKPGQSTGDVGMTLMSAEHQVLADVSKTVSVADCDHVLFVLPNGGVTVAPGQVYSIELIGVGGVFGWKYVVGGYANGVASSEGRPLLPDRRSTFLFRTFGAKCVTGNDCDVPAHPER